MKKGGLFLLLSVVATYGMENSENGSNGWRGSYEQCVCCCAGSAVFLASQAYLFARTTPNEQFPVLRGFGPELSYPIEYLHAANIAEFLAVLCCCYYHEWPTHSICADTARNTFDVYCRVSDSWSRAMGWPICECGEERSGSWNGNMWSLSDPDGLPTYGDLAAVVQVKVDANKKQK